MATLDTLSLAAIQNFDPVFHVADRKERERGAKQEGDRQRGNAESIGEEADTNARGDDEIFLE